MRIPAYFVALALIFVLFVLSGCATPAPPTPTATKPSIPRDLELVCHEGFLGAKSDSAKEGVLFPIPCPSERRT